MLSNNNGVYVGPGWTWSGSGLKVSSGLSTTQSLSYNTNVSYIYSPNYTYVWTISVTASGGFVNNGNYIFPFGNVLPPTTSNRSLDFYEPWNNSNIPDFSYKQSVSGFITTDRWSTNRPGDLIYMTSIFNNISNFSSKIRMKISSTSEFGNGLHPDARFLKFNLKKTDWIIEGWSWRDDDNNEGWKWNSSNNSVKFDYRRSQWEYDNILIPGPPFPSSTIDINRSFHYAKGGISRINFVSKFINFETFNFSLSFDKQGDIESYLKVYLIKNIKNNNSSLSSQLMASGNFESSFNTDYQYLGKLSETGTYSFYNLTGNQYLAFFAWYPTASTIGTYSLQLSDLKIEGGYSRVDNNNDFLLTTSNIYDESQTLSLFGTSTQSSFDATVTTPQTLHETPNIIFGLTGGNGTYSGFFSDLYGTVSNIASLKSKIGNGKFRAGIWENGIWNSGKRIDDDIKYFNTIESYLKMNSQSTTWRVQLLGSTQSTSGINIGDNVSVSNIAVIDINDERRILSTKWKVININNRRVVLETESVFPIMRIEKDSENHKILVTKNVWLNGIFFNGLFSGVWNNGLVTGYPYITQFEGTHWLNGDFRGGHFKSDKKSVGFVDTYYWEGNVGLTFGATAHGFVQGDIIEIDKFDKSINPQYDGSSKVIEVIDDYLIITDKPWGQNTSGESGSVKSQATGLIQNMNFDSLNVSKKTSKETQNLKEIWKYNSWMDLNWNDQSSTNINTDRTYYNNNPSNIGMTNDIYTNNKFGLGEYSPLNLWGLTTDDVLKSESKFRNINNTLIKSYSLGTKWNIFQDYLGNISQFNESFGSSDEWGGLTNFLNNGWTFSYFSATNSGVNTNTPNIYRTIDGTFKYEAADDDIGILLLNNNNINIEKSRYSVIEFDYLSGPEHVLSFSASENYVYDFHYLDLFNFPVFSITDNQSIKWSNIDAFPQKISPVYSDLSIFSKGINYSKGLKKKEFFYNRLGLDLGLFSMGVYTNREFYVNIFSPILFSEPNGGSQSYHFELDNIKFYEVDMIPFFNYTTEEYINSDIQVPYFGRSPKINLADSDFNFLENTNLSLQGVILNKSDETITIPQLPNDGESDLLFK